MPALASIVNSEYSTCLAPNLMRLAGGNECVSKKERKNDRKVSSASVTQTTTVLWYSSYRYDGCVKHCVNQTKVELSM